MQIHVRSRGHLTETIIEFAALPSPAKKENGMEWNLKKKIHLACVNKERDESQSGGSFWRPETMCIGR